MQKSKSSKKQAATQTPQPVVIHDCEPSPNPVTLSKTGTLYPNAMYFITQDRDRVYEVKIKGKVFVGKPGSFKLPVWFGHDSETITVDPNAKKERFGYDIRALVGLPCIQPKTPPEIIIEN